MYNILACDGGGIRGCFTARILQRIETAVPGFLASVHLFAGTSTGGILALGLASGMQPLDIINLYLNNAKIIFPPVSEFTDLFHELKGPKYSNVGLEYTLESVFKATLIGQLTKDVIVTTYDLIHRKPIAMDRINCAATSLVDASLRTSAAPTYFPPHQNFIDGGVAANNPAMVAMVWALHNGTKLEDIRLLSIGTGNANLPPFDAGSASPIDWLKRGLINILLDGPVGFANWEITELLGLAMLRVDGEVDCALDETTNLTDRLLLPADTLDLTDAIAFAKGIV